EVRADGDDAIAGDRDVGDDGGLAGAVHHGATTDDEVVHGRSPLSEPVWASIRRGRDGIPRRRATTSPRPCYAPGMTDVRTFCRVCEPACGLVAKVDDGEIT